MARKKARSASAPPKKIITKIDVRPPDPVAPDDEENLRDYPADPWPELAELFGDGSSPIRVELYRVSPKFAGDVKINGYLEQLTFENCNLDYVKTSYGGGNFRVIKRNAGGDSAGFIKQYYFDIAGAPKLPAIAPAAAGLSPATDTPPAAPVAIANYEGLPITGELKRDMETVKSVLIFKDLLRSGESDLTKELIRLLVADRRQFAPDPLSTLRDLAPTLQALREFLPNAGESEGSGNTGFNDIIKAALTTFGEYLKTARSAPRAATPAAIAPAPGPRLLPENPPPAAVVVADSNAKTDPEADPENEGNPMSLTPQAIIDSAVAAIVQNFRLGKEPERVVSFLNSRIPLSSEQRKQFLESRKAELFDAAEMLLDDQLEDYSENAGERKRFAEFWNVVFDTFLAGGE